MTETGELKVAVDRLQVEQEEAIRHYTSLGMKTGMAWANQAPYAELALVATISQIPEEEIEDSTLPSDAWDVFEQITNQLLPPFAVGWPLRNAWLDAFQEAVLLFWDDVRQELIRRCAKKSASPEMGIV